MWHACDLSVRGSFVQRLDMTMYSVFCILASRSTPVSGVASATNTPSHTRPTLDATPDKPPSYALACSWLKLPPTLRLTLKLVLLKKMKVMMDMDMEER
jgi:hypothetical protein